MIIKMIDQSIKLGLLNLAYFIVFLYHKLSTIIPNVSYYFHHYSRQRIPKNLRVPEHIAFAFTNESNQIDLIAVTDLICWCKQLGIKYVTLYDEFGKIKCNQRELYRCLDHKSSLLDDDNPHYMASSNGNGYITAIANDTSFKHISYIKGLTILSRQDGRKKFVEDIKGLLRVEPKKIDLELVQKHVGWTCDPELLVNFGSQQCLHGFPPWQLRLTEIFSLPSHRNITHKMFMDCLEKYSRTTQRLGA